MHCNESFVWFGCVAAEIRGGVEWLRIARETRRTCGHQCSGYVRSREVPAWQRVDLGRFVLAGNRDVMFWLCAETRSDGEVKCRADSDGQVENLTVWDPWRDFKQRYGVGKLRNGVAEPVRVVWWNCRVLGRIAVAKNRKEMQWRSRETRRLAGVL
jgi:hypothetical protein